MLIFVRTVWYERRFSTCVLKPLPIRSYSVHGCTLNPRVIRSAATEWEVVSSLPSSEQTAMVLWEVALRIVTIAFAFLVLTAEDEVNDGAMQACMNAVHEVGLFRGRLGFNRAIVLLEEGCAEFSNINGLGQLRFPRGKIAAVFHEVDKVLVRVGLLAAR